MTFMLLEGEVLKERYRINKVLGQGAYGTVYLAEDLQIPQVLWAVKEIWEGDLEYEEQQEALDRFEREASLLKNLNHPGLPKVVDFFSIGPGHYLVMEFIEGKSFEEFCKEHEGPVRQEEIFFWVNKIADILQYLHEQSPPIIFRDLKPGNMIVTTGGRVKLIDFGIARHYNPEKASDTTNLGTPGFCAPEQYGKGQSDARTDIYSLGATLYYALSRQDVAAFNFKFPPLLKYNSHISPRLADIIMKCLKLEPGERFQSISELKTALGTVSGVSARRAPGKVKYVSANAVAFENLVKAPFVRKAALFAVALFLAGVVVMCVPPLCKAGFVAVIMSLFSITALAGYLFLALVFLVLKDMGKVQTLQAAATGISQGQQGADRVVKGVLALAGGGVLIFLAVFVLIGYTGFSSARTHSQLSACKANMRALSTAIEAYAAEYDCYPPTLNTLTPTCMKNLPRCPNNKAHDYLYTVTQSPKAGFTLTCAGHNHGNFPSDSPRYSNTTGFIEQ